MLASGGRAQRDEKFSAERRRLVMKEGFSFSGYERDVVSLLRGGHYTDISGVTGADSVTDARAAAFADMDNDGDLDVVVASEMGYGERRTLLFRNNVGNRLNYLRVTLEGRESGRDAAGARVRVTTPDGETQTKLKSIGSGFGGQSDPRLLFGLGKNTEATTVEISWPSGRTQRFGPFPAERSLLFVEGGAAPVELTDRRFALPDPRPPAWEETRLVPGQALPEIEIEGLEGTNRDAADVLPAGVPVLVNFWATWCAGCRAEMPALQFWHERRETAGGITVVGFDTDEPEDRAKVGPFLKRAGVRFPIFFVRDVEALYSNVAPALPLPLTLLVDGDKRVVDVQVGVSPHRLRRKVRDSLGISLDEPPAVSPAEEAATLPIRPITGPSAPSAGGPDGDTPPPSGAPTAEAGTRKDRDSAAFEAGLAYGRGGSPSSSAAACDKMMPVARPFCREGAAAGAYLTRRPASARALFGELLSTGPVYETLTCMGLGVGYGMGKSSLDGLTDFVSELAKPCRELAFDGAAFAAAIAGGERANHLPPACLAGPTSMIARACAHGHGRQMFFAHQRDVEKAIAACDGVGPALRAACVAGAGLAAVFPDPGDPGPVFRALDRLSEADQAALLLGFGRALSVRHRIDAAFLEETVRARVPPEQQGRYAEAMSRVDRCLAGAGDSLDPYWMGCPIASPEGPAQE